MEDSATGNMFATIAALVFVPDFSHRLPWLRRLQKWLPRLVICLSGPDQAWFVRRQGKALAQAFRRLEIQVPIPPIDMAQGLELMILDCLDKVFV